MSRWIQTLMNTAAVNRGYQKIEGAVKAFNFDFKDKVVLDIGSSTGGFTELALKKGARKVIAVEKGTNQMKAPLRFDERIDLHEKTNVFDFRLAEDEKPDVIVADVSFVSLTKILKYAKIHLSKPSTRFLVMLKPQFEATPGQLNRGVVKNEAIRRQIVRDFEYYLKSNGFIVMNKRDNELKGRTGNLERFYDLILAK